MRSSALLACLLGPGLAAGASAASLDAVFADGFEDRYATPPLFLPDAGIRIDYASNAKAGIDADGTVFLYYEDRQGGGARLATSADGLGFGSGSSYNTYVAHPGRVQLGPDLWRRYSLSMQYQLSSQSSLDGISFVAEAGVRYSPAAADQGSMGVYDIFVAGDQVVMLYLGDLFGLNNTRRAVSLDGGLSFSFDRGNILGDDGAGGGSNSYVDLESHALPDGSRRLYAMRGGMAIHSFRLDGDGLNALAEGIRVHRDDWSEFTVSGLFDPTVVELPDGRWRMYLTGQLQGRQAILSATSQ